MYGLLLILVALPFAAVSLMVLGFNSWGSLRLREKIGFGSTAIVSYSAMIYGFALYDVTNKFGQHFELSTIITSSLPF